MISPSRIISRARLSPTIRGSRTVDSHVRHDAVPGLQQAHRCAFGEDAKVASQGQLQTGAVGVPADGRQTGATPGRGSN